MTRKANGQGHTYKVANSYRTVIRLGDHTITAMAPSAQESRKKAKLKVESLPNIMGKRGNLPRPRFALREYLIDWLENDHKNQIAHTTYKRYRALITHHIIPAIGGIELQKLTTADINALITAMRDAGQSPRSQQQARAVLSIALRDAAANEYIKINPVKNSKSPQVKQREIQPLSIEEVRRLLQTFKGTYMAARLHLALICGLRQGEALGLCWQDVDLHAGTLQIKQQVQFINGKLVFTQLKTDRSRRTVVLTQETLETLKEHLVIVNGMKSGNPYGWLENNLIFPNIDGSPRASTNDYNEWKRALRLCGIAKRRLHDARHTAATLMYSQGIGIETISRLLGHSSSTITSKLYVHTALEPLEDAARQIDKILNLK